MKKANKHQIENVESADVLEEQRKWNTKKKKESKKVSMLG